MTIDFLKTAWAVLAANLADKLTVNGRRLWGAVVAGLDRVRRSFVALVSSPAAWLAVIVIGLTGFWGGHIMGAHGKRALRERAATAERTAAAATDRAVMLAGANREALVQIKALKGKVEALEAEAARAAAGTPKSGSVAAVSRRPVVRVPKRKAPASEPAAWLPPWGR